VNEGMDFLEVLALYDCTVAISFGNAACQSNT